MMPSRILIEVRALEVFDMVKSGAPIEDSLVELKSDWIDPQKAARRIAGHANAARGEGILWIIGLDEEKGVCNFSHNEFSNWWAKVKSNFDGITPKVYDYLFKTEDGPIQVLFFDTSAGPFLVKNPVFGQKNAGPVKREVPWREATKVRSATREDLIRLLIPIQKLPAIELLSARVKMKKEEPKELRWGEARYKVQESEHFAWDFGLNFYITPPQNNSVVLPVHRTNIVFRVNDKNEFLDTLDIRYFSPSIPTASIIKTDSVSIRTTRAEAIINLPGRLQIESYYYEPVREIKTKCSLYIRFSVKPAGTDHSIVKETKLPMIIWDEKSMYEWSTEK